jgi:AAHS family 4-hydroxybenzoate transporter-like MFS transporter
MPNAVTLTSEFSPEARRATLTNAMFCGFPLGAALGGFLAAWMIPIWGWRSVLMLGGAAPLLLLVVMFFTLPESVRHMVAKAYPAERIRAVLARISASAASATSFTLSESGRPQGAGHRQGGIAMLFQPRYLVGTCMLWLAYFMGLVIFYALVNWMPVLFKDAGLAPKTATLISALFPLGGVGAILFGWLMDRYNANRVIATGFALTACGVRHRPGSRQRWHADRGGVCGWRADEHRAIVAAGTGGLLPDPRRATGVAWMLGVGRFGGIAGSFLVAELSRQQMGFSDVFTVVSLAAVVSTMALLIKQAADRGNPDGGKPVLARGAAAAAWPECLSIAAAPPS